MDYVDPIEYVGRHILLSMCWRIFLFRVTKKVIAGVYNGVTTVELDVYYSLLHYSDLD